MPPKLFSVMVWMACELMCLSNVFGTLNCFVWRGGGILFITRAPALELFERILRFEDLAVSSYFSFANLGYFWKISARAALRCDGGSDERRDFIPP